MEDDVSLVGTVPLVVTVPSEVVELLEAVLTVLDTVRSADSSFGVVGDLFESSLTSLFCRMCSRSGLLVGVTGLPAAVAELSCSGVVGVPLQSNSEDGLSVSTVQ